MTTASNETRTQAIANRFALTAPVERIASYGKGLINDTFLVMAGGTRYILQRINGSVFPRPERIMANLALLQEHLTSWHGKSPRLPALIPARDALPFVRGADGAVWRLMELIPDSRSLGRIESPVQAREVGRILGRFHAATSGLDPDRLTVTLPGFHVTPAYLKRFAKVLTGATSHHVGEVQQHISFVTDRPGGTDVLEGARRDGRIPVRVIHGDPKLDNILFDRVTGRAVSLIDLDTVQPGLVHYDLGDCLRSCCNRGGESAAEGANARFDLDICEAVLSAYADEMRGVLGSDEVELLFDAIRLLPFELGLRFLTDHLEGDRYFRVTERGQNLRKARVQFALVENIEAKEREIRRIIAACFEANA